LDVGPLHPALGTVQFDESELFRTHLVRVFGWIKPSGESRATPDERSTNSINHYLTSPAAMLRQNKHVGDQAKVA
jgi:hypothetical protein